MKLQHSLLVIISLCLSLTALSAEKNQIISHGSKKTITIKTSRGTMKMVVFPDSPISSTHFLKLTIGRFYNGLNFHRIVPGLLVQTGDPFSRDLGDPRVGTGNSGVHLKSEFNSRKHRKGTVGLAHSVANKNDSSSQFYITLKKAPHLDGRFTVVGQITDGLAILDQLRVGDTVISMSLNQ